MRWLLLSFLVCLPALALAQSASCEARCNQQAADCLKACTGEPKEAQRKGDSKRLVECLAQCERQTRECKQPCRGR